MRDGFKMVEKLLRIILLALLLRLVLAIIA